MAKSSRTRSGKKPSKSVGTSGAKGLAGGLKVERVFSDAGRNPFEQVSWDERSVAITDESGKVVFEAILDGEEDIVISLPKLVASKAEAGWSVTMEVARIKGKWGILGVGNVYP